jgi:glucoamylase
MTDSHIEKHDCTQPVKPNPAPGGPGAKPRWSSSAKTAVGTTAQRSSRVWFTLGQGVLNEVYYPDIDLANTRMARFLVADGEDFFSDEANDAHHTAIALATGVPGYRIVSLCKRGRYKLTKEFIADPARDVILMDVTFEPLDDSNLQLYYSVEPHLADQGAGNSAWAGTYQGIHMLFAARLDVALSLHASVPFLQTTCGFIGKNDGYTQLKENRKLTSLYNQATDGNIGLCGELDWKLNGGRLLLALAFGHYPAEAGQQARAGVLADYEASRQAFIQRWQKVQSELLDLHIPKGSAHDLYRVSTAVLRAHESKHFPGAFIASLSLPWGFSKGDKDTGGYHVLWPRDLCETAMGLMACGDFDAGRRALFYLACIQKHDGSWSQNVWLDGTEHWPAVQMDGIAMPILLADQLRRAGELKADAWPMIRRAARFLVRIGPVTGQDRWEALSGYSTFTMAVEIAALLAAADFADLAQEAEEAEFLRLTADAWNDAVDTLTYATGTELAKQSGVGGYYVRITPEGAIEKPELNRLWLTLANHKPLTGHHRAVDVVSPDALALVRFGLRSAHDPRLQSTVKVIDASLQRQMTTGVGWIRSTDDGYGEHEDGSPYDGTGIGHCWPLLAGERGHFAVAAGDLCAAEELLKVISQQTSECGMIPEQVWSAPDIPGHSLFNGHPAGSGMPLAWAHAEYLKLLRSLHEQAVWDMPPQTVKRYQVDQIKSRFEIWTEQSPRHWVSPNRNLRMDFAEPAHISWNVDDRSVETVQTNLPVLGVHAALLQLPEQWQTLNVDVEQGGRRRKFHLEVRS